MKAHHLLLALAFGLAAAWIASASPGITGSAEPLTPTIVGSSEGAWDLPTGDADGFANGILTIGSGFPMFMLSATLPASTVTEVRGQSAGTLEGILVSFPLSPDPVPFANVSGHWEVLDSATGAGRFRAFFSTGDGPGVPGPTILIGAMRGTFEDLEQPGGPDSLGSYSAKWALF